MDYIFDFLACESRKNGREGDGSSQHARWKAFLYYAAAGTHRFFQTGVPDIWDYPGNNGSFVYSIAHVAVFAGPDEATGYRGTFISRSNPNIVWHVGDVVVTNPSPGCSRYAWQTVDQYGTRHLLLTTADKGAGEVILEECVPAHDPSQCASFSYSETTPMVTCGFFGDPHLSTFDGKNVTCDSKTGACAILVDNKYFTLETNVESVSQYSNATAVGPLRFHYKHECNPTVLRTLERTGNYGAPYSYRHTIKVTESASLEVDALRLKIGISRHWFGITGAALAITMPASLASISTGLCVQSCPANSLIDITDLPRDTKYNQSVATCTSQGATPGTFEFDSCVFDVTITGETKYGALATNWVRIMRSSRVPIATTPLPPDAPPQYPAPDDPSSGDPSSPKPISDAATSSRNLTPITLLLIALSCAFALVTLNY